MNILPKKRWHVRTRENIARVRKDEQEAASEAEERKQRVLRAEKEARTTLLRERAQKKYGITECVRTVTIQETGEGSTSNDQKHVNFFEDLEEGKIVTTKTNVETEREEKEIREKYEKQIGYLTYLGQDTVETTGNIPWYEKVPDHAESNFTMKDEKNMKSKLLHDPLAIFRKYLPSNAKRDVPSEGCKRKSSVIDYDPIFERKDKKKKKKRKKKVKKHKKRKYNSNDDPTSESEQSTSDSDEETKVREKRKSLELLRAERLHREKQERERSEALLNKINGVTPQNSKTEPITPVVQQKYNSQYNPELAKQNYSKNSWSK